jgi:Phosphate-selective porin O and P
MVTIELGKVNVRRLGVLTRGLAIAYCVMSLAGASALGQEAPVQPEPVPQPVPPGPTAEPAPPDQPGTEPPPVVEPEPQPPSESPIPLTTEPPPERVPEAEEEEGDEILGRAGWKPGTGFVIATDDESYLLRVGLQSGYKAELVRRDGEFQDRVPFFVLRPLITGNLFKPWIQFWTSMELARNPPYLLDSYVDIKPIDEFGLRVGQQFTPFSRHEYYGPQQLLFPEFAPVAEYFWSGRDKGFTALGTLAKTLEYWLGLYGGSPLRQFTTIQGNYVVEGRLTYSPMGPVGANEYAYIVPDGEPPAPFGVSFTLQGYYGKVQSAIENFNPSTFQFVATASGETTKKGVAGLDFFLQSSRFVFFAEGYFGNSNVEDDEMMGETPDYNSIGAWGQAGYMLVDNRLDVAVRASWLDASDDLDDDEFLGIEGQLAYYPAAPHIVLKLRYGYGDQNTPGEDALGPVRLALTPGELHLATLQLNVAF